MVTHEGVTFPILTNTTDIERHQVLYHLDIRETKAPLANAVVTRTRKQEPGKDEGGDDVCGNTEEVEGKKEPPTKKRNNVD